MFQEIDISRSRPVKSQIIYAMSELPLNLPLIAHVRVPFAVDLIVYDVDRVPSDGVS